MKYIAVLCCCIVGAAAGGTSGSATQTPADAASCRVNPPCCTPCCPECPNCGACCDPSGCCPNCGPAPCGCYT